MRRRAPDTSCDFRSRGCWTWIPLPSTSLSTPCSSFPAASIRSRGIWVRDDLLLYYERELTFLRQMGAEFAGKYPKIASRLVLEPDKCEDPHAERLQIGRASCRERV